MMELINKEIIALRQELHAKPNLSNAEYETAAIIKQFLAQHQPTEIIEGIGGAGIAAVYRRPKKGKTITIRCELDALPIQENNPFSYQSTNNVVSHKCGHDGHMAIVASLALWLKKKELDSGTVILLFQPAEETGEGAVRVIHDNKFKTLKTDYVFALHNIPRIPLNSIVLMGSGFSAEVQSFIIKLKGKESHAAEPENGINPALCMAQLVTSISNLNVDNPEDEAFAILTPVHINIGQKAYGISPGEGELHYTMRTWNEEHMQSLKSSIVKIVQAHSKHHGLAYELSWLEYFPASTNDEESNNYVRQAAKDHEYAIIESSYPFKFGEDFGWFSRHYKTAMFGLGSGVNTPALHNADYDFPDEILSTGFSMFKTIIECINI